MPFVLFSPLQQGHFIEQKPRKQKPRKAQENWLTVLPRPFVALDIRRCSGDWSTVEYPHKGHSCIREIHGATPDLLQRPQVRLLLLH